jgi:hypothetical protein
MCQVAQHLEVEKGKDRKPKSASKNHKAITTSQKPQKEAIEVLSNVKFKEKSNTFFRISSCHNFLPSLTNLFIEAFT